MTDHDPLDELLRGAFAADRARMPPVDVADRVLARIRRHARIRALTLGAVILSGLVVIAGSLDPALAVLQEAAHGTLESWRGNTVAVTVLVLSGAAWLGLVEGDAA